MDRSFGPTEQAIGTGESVPAVGNRSGWMGPVEDQVLGPQSRHIDIHPSVLPELTMAPSTGPTGPTEAPELATDAREGVLAVGIRSGWMAPVEDQVLGPQVSTLIHRNVATMPPTTEPTEPAEAPTEPAEVPQETVEAPIEPTEVQGRGRGKPLGNPERIAILEALLARSSPHDDRKLIHGSIGAVARQFGVTAPTVSSVWKRGKQSIEDGGGHMDVAYRRASCGRKKKDYSAQLATLPNVPLLQRTSLRATAASLGVPMSAVHRLLKNKQGIRVHSSATRPLLTPANMTHRLQHCAANIDRDRRLYHSMMDVVHVDEKWFYMSPTKQRYYLAEGEADPHRLIILNDGTNNFRLPHMNKDRLARQGQLPMSIDVTDEVEAKLDVVNGVNEEEAVAPVGAEV